MHLKGTFAVEYLGATRVGGKWHHWRWQAFEQRQQNICNAPCILRSQDILELRA